MKLIGENLACERGERVVFEGVNFSVSRGDLLVLIGRNGAGKTSLLRMIAGLNEPVAGRLQLDGGHADLTIGQHAHFVAHQSALKPSLTVKENLAFWADFLGGGYVDAALEAFNLSALANYPCARLSAGQLRRLALSRLVLVSRPLWLLDEPTVGLDTASLKLLRGLMKRHLTEGGMIVAATHVSLGLKGARQFDFADLEPVS